VASYALTPAQVFDKVKDSVVVVKTLDTQGKVKAQGSGVILSPGRVATNCHVVEGGASYRVGRGKELLPATLYAEDSDKDICLLDAMGIQGKPAQLGKAAGLKVGDPVYAVGAPQGLELSLSGGMVAQLRGGPSPLIQTTAAISPGSSGGGLFDAEGRLVGLTTFYVQGGQNLNFAMPVEWIGEVKPGRAPAVGGTGSNEWSNRVASLVKANDWQGLLECCLKWTKSEPENVGAWLILGLAYQKLQRRDEEIEAYRQALRIDPNDGSVWSVLGLAYYQANRHDEALEAYRQGVRVNPDNANAWTSLGFGYLFGHAAHMNRFERYTEAVKAYRQALKIVPNDGQAWSNLGMAYGELKLYNEAAEAYRQAVGINPSDANAWTSLGDAYLSARRYNEAAEALRQAIRIDPNNTSAWNFLANTYWASGNDQLALDALRSLRRIDPAQADALYSWFMGHGGISRGN
jgi:tetratricopeptide (TPR) repeat protein